MPKEQGLVITVAGGSDSGKTTIAGFIGKQLGEAGFKVEYDWQEQLATGAVEEKVYRLEAMHPDNNFLKTPIRIVERQMSPNIPVEKQKVSSFTDELLVTPADYATEAVLDNLQGRSGIGNELDGYDREIMRDIFQSVSAAISESMGK